MVPTADNMYKAAGPLTGGHISLWFCGGKPDSAFLPVFALVLSVGSIITDEPEVRPGFSSVV